VPGHEVEAYPKGGAGERYCGEIQRPLLVSTLGGREGEGRGKKRKTTL
jgi:hypothetical protein